MLLQIRKPRGCARGVRELACEPRPCLDLGEQIGNVDVRHQSIQLCSQPDGSGVLIQLLGERVVRPFPDDVVQRMAALPPQKHSLTLRMLLTEIEGHQFGH